MEDPLCKVLMTEYQQWKEHHQNQTPAVPDAIDSALSAVGNSILSGPRMADASIALP